MLPLPAGGRVDRDTGGPMLSIPLPGKQSLGAGTVRRYRALGLLLTVVAAVAAQTAAARAEPATRQGMAAHEIQGPAGLAKAWTDPIGIDGLAVVSYVTPSVAAEPRRSDRGFGTGHWTLRDSASVRAVKAESSGTENHPAGAAYLGGRTTVAMFSWREIAFAALVVAFALGALLALTGGGDNHRSRNY